MDSYFCSSFPSTDRSKLLYNTCQIHTFTQTAHQEKFGVQYLAQGHLDMQLGGAGFRAMQQRRKNRRGEGRKEERGEWEERGRRGEREGAVNLDSHPEEDLTTSTWTHRTTLKSELKAVIQQISAPAGRNFHCIFLCLKVKRHTHIKKVKVEALKPTKQHLLTVCPY